jgi:hypothetical protein
MFPAKGYYSRLHAQCTYFNKHVARAEYANEGYTALFLWEKLSCYEFKAYCTLAMFIPGSDATRLDGESRDWHGAVDRATQCLPYTVSSSGETTMRRANEGISLFKHFCFGTK